MSSTWANNKPRCPMKQICRKLTDVTFFLLGPWLHIMESLSNQQITRIKVLKVCLGLQYYWSPCSEQYLLTTAFTLSLTPGCPHSCSTSQWPVPAGGMVIQQADVRLSGQVEIGEVWLSIQNSFHQDCVQINNGSSIFIIPHGESIIYLDVTSISNCI